MSHLLNFVLSATKYFFLECLKTSRWSSTCLLLDVVAASLKIPLVLAKAKSILIFLKNDSA